MDAQTLPHTRRPGAAAIRTVLLLALSAIAAIAQPTWTRLYTGQTGRVVRILATTPDSLFLLGHAIDSFPSPSGCDTVLHLSFTARTGRGGANFTSIRTDDRWPALEGMRDGRRVYVGASPQSNRYEWKITTVTPGELTRSITGGGIGYLNVVANPSPGVTYVMGTRFGTDTTLAIQRRDELFDGAVDVSPTGYAGAMHAAFNGAAEIMVSVRTGGPVRQYTVLHSSDSGATWTEVPLPISPTTRIGQVRHVNGSTWIVGTENGIYRTSVNGASWSLREAGRWLQLGFANDTIGYAVPGGAEHGQIARTADGGVSWTLFDLPGWWPLYHELNCVAAPRSNLAFIGCDSGVVMRFDLGVSSTTDREPVKSSIEVRYDRDGRAILHLPASTLPRPFTIVDILGSIVYRADVAPGVECVALDGLVPRGVYWFAVAGVGRRFVGGRGD